MAKILNKGRRYRFDLNTSELLTRIAKYRIEAKFVREAVKEKFERDYPKWIEEQQKKNEKDLPF